MRAARLRRTALMRLGIAVSLISLAAGARAQTPPPYPPPPAPPIAVAPAAPASPEAAEVAACLCLRQAVDALGADMSARQHAYDDVRGELARLDSQLEQQRARIDVNNPEAVGRFRQLLQQRDAVFRRSTGPVAGDLSAVVERYNSRVNEFNARCANRPRDPRLIESVQATLSCPPP